MKKELFILTTVFLCSCSSPSVRTDNHSDTASNHKQEDTAVVSKMLTSFTSPDRQLFDVRGNVSELTVKTTKCDSTWNGNLEYEKWRDETYTFNKAGEVQFNPKEKVRLTRNSNGQLTKKETYIEDYSIYVANEYVYNKQGRLDSLKGGGPEWRGTKSFQYDNLGNQLSTQHPFTSEGSYYYETESFEIVEQDSHDNWTKRHVKSVLKSGGEEGKYNNLIETTYRIETREISYY